MMKKVLIALVTRALGMIHFQRVVGIMTLKTGPQMKHAVLVEEG